MLIDWFTVAAQIANFAILVWLRFSKRQTPITGITPLISELLLAIEQQRERDGLDEVHIFHNEPRQRATYEPVAKRLLPLDVQWRRVLKSIPWPTHALPEIICRCRIHLDRLDT